MSSPHAEKRPFYASRRNQRMLLFAAALVFLVGLVAVLVAYFGNTAESLEAPLSNEPADVYAPRKQVALDPEARRVAGEFILTAVARKDLAASYDLVHPDLRQGLTRTQWQTGNIPVVYYPTDRLDVATFKIDESYVDEVYMEVALIPKDGTDVKPQVFFIGLKRVGGPNGPWKVSYWIPRAAPEVPAGRD